MSVDGGLRALFHRNLPRPHWQSIASGYTSLGIPDDNACHEGVEFWVEYKATRAGSDSHLLSTFRPEQVAWLLRRHRAGGRVFVATRRVVAPGRRRVAGDELYLHSGEHAIALKSRGLQGAPALGAWNGGPAGWDWDEVLRLLTK